MSPEQIIEEINLIPEEKRQELYKLIRDFRIGLKESDSKANQIMQFAGSWLDIPEENFDNFCTEIEQRRQANLARRSEF